MMRIQEGSEGLRKGQEEEPRTRVQEGKASVRESPRESGKGQEGPRGARKGKLGGSLLRIQAEGPGKSRRALEGEAIVFTQWLPGTVQTLSLSPSLCMVNASCSRSLAKPLLLVSERVRAPASGTLVSPDRRQERRRRRRREEAWGLSSGACGHYRPVG